MPAVLLSRLKIQSAQVCEAAGEPAAFLSALKRLFDEYADRTYRPGRQGKPAPLSPHFNVPRPVFRQVEVELARVLSQNPGYALPLADALWADGSLEIRHLAVGILASLEPDPPEPLTSRILQWADPQVEPAILDALLASGRMRLQTQRPDVWLNLLETWLDNPSPPVMALGLRGLLSLVSADSFTNLPAAFRLLNPLLRSGPPALSAEILDVLACLARRSPGETAFFLRQVAAGEGSPALSRIIRRSLPFFSGDQLAALKETLAGIHMV